MTIIKYNFETLKQHACLPGYWRCPYCEDWFDQSRATYYGSHYAGRCRDNIGYTEQHNAVAALASGQILNEAIELDGSDVDGSDAEGDTDDDPDEIIVALEEPRQQQQHQPLQAYQSSTASSTATAGSYSAGSRRWCCTRSTIGPSGNLSPRSAANRWTAWRA